ncbi:MAG: GTPase ObgE, partial [Polyangiaceae bacterium]|nr:GTPase ObgE [Polyangiaceae bacterium]
MRFIDEASLRVEAGNGGNGSVAFRREPHVPFGGPSGGDGGAGGHVIFVGDEGKNSLLDLKHLRTIVAGRGEHGKGRDKYGKAGRTEKVRIPVGTVISDADSGELLGELLEHGQEIVVARGGEGGRGNKHFATPTDRAPHKAEEGTPGEERDLKLELKMMADIGLLGFPNVGKSTFISVVSQARPKIAD